MISRMISGVISNEVGIEIIPSVFHCFGQSVDIVFRRVNVEARANGGRGLEIGLVEELGAMLTAAAGDALAIEVGCGILGEDSFDVEGDDPRFGIRVINLRVPGLQQFFHGVLFQFPFVFDNRIKPKVFEIFDRFD